MKSKTAGKIPKELKNPSDMLAEGLRALEVHWWYWDLSDNELIISPETMKILGYSAEEFDAHLPTFDKRIHPKDVEEMQKRFRTFLDGETEVLELEFRINLEKGWNWYYVRGTVIKRTDDSKPAMVGGLLMDISRRYDRLIAKVEEGSKFEFIFRNTNEAVVILTLGDENKPGKIIEVNAAAERLVGAKTGQLIGMNPYDPLDKSYLERRHEFRSNLVKDGVLRVELKTRDLQGNEKILELFAHTYNYTGESLYIAIAIDKTESYKVKEELQASEVALRQSEKIYRSLIQTANDRIGLFRTDGKPEIVNKSFYEVLGFSKEEYLKLEDKERVHPDDKELLQDLQSRIFETGFAEAEYRARHKNGHYIHMSSKTVLLTDPELEHDYVLMIIRDITEKVRYEKELIKAKEKAEESDLLKSAFLANMSHEIRTPMNSIVGFANLLSEDDLDKHTRDEYIERINRNSEQLLALISDIIDLAKIESNQMSVHYSPVYVENLFNDLLNFGILQLNQRKRDSVKIAYDPDPDARELAMETDLVRLTQIMQNLIHNAVKFTAKGEIKIGYRMEDHSMVRFFVEDSGTGIDRENFEIIFDQFRQVDGSNIRKYGGTGLGLAICKNLAAMLNGKIWLESTKGKGSVFHVLLPFSEAISVEENEDESQTGKALNDNLSVLIVDDDQDTLMLITTILRNEGIHAITADSGYEALSLLERDLSPDLVLLDLQMPVMSGLETFRIIHEKYPGMKVVAQSAHAIEGEKEKLLATGFNEYVTKPFERKKLVSLIRKITGK